MIRIMIVDDEPLMRQYLSTIIPTFSAQYEILATAADGIEASEMLAQHAVDIVITDIKMPEMDGLSLAKHIRDTYPETVVIIISGYSDFEYARKAIKYNVSDYLLKPLNDSALQELLAEICARSEKEKAKGPLAGAAAENLTDRQQVLYAALNNDARALFRAYERIKAEPEQIFRQVGCVVKGEPDGTGFLPCGIAEAQSAHHSLSTTLKELCDQANAPMVSLVCGECFILLTAENESELTDKLRQLHALTRQRVTAYPIRFLCGDYVRDLAALPRSARSLAPLYPLTLLSEAEILSQDDLKTRESELAEYRNLFQQLCDDVSQHETDKVKVDIHHLLKQYSHGESRDVWKLGCHILHHISERFPIAKEKQREALSEFAELCALITPQIPESFSYKLLYKMLSSLTDTESDDTQTTPLIREAKEYILQNYSRNISQSDVADHCKISSSYLSDLFHKEMDISYSKYLLSIRMEQAVRLIGTRPELRIYEIAEMVGFLSAKHFITVFKNYYGVTPTAFVKSKEL